MKFRVKPHYRARYKKGEMNRDELRFYNDFCRTTKGTEYEIHFEAVKFTLAPRTTYTPDFLIASSNGMEIVEIKGFLHDDSAVKFKCAAEKFRGFKWRMIRWKKDHWETIYEFLED